MRAYDQQGRNWRSSLHDMTIAITGESDGTPLVLGKVKASAVETLPGDSFVIEISASGGGTAL